MKRARLLNGPADGLEVDLGAGTVPAVLRVQVTERHAEVITDEHARAAPWADVYNIDRANDTTVIYVWTPPR